MDFPSLERLAAEGFNLLSDKQMYSNILLSHGDPGYLPIYSLIIEAKKPVETPTNC